MARALLELASAVHGEWAASIRHVVQFDARMLGVERVSFWSLAEDMSRLHCDAGYIVSTRSFERGATILASDQAAYFEAIRDGRMVSVEDVFVDSRTQRLPRLRAVRGITSMLDMPVWVDGRLAGVLCHEHVGARRPWRPAKRTSRWARARSSRRCSQLAPRPAPRPLLAARLSSTASRAGVLPSLDMREIAGRALDLVVPGSRTSR